MNVCQQISLASAALATHNMFGEIEDNVIDIFDMVRHSTSYIHIHFLDELNCIATQVKAVWRSWCATEKILSQLQTEMDYLPFSKPLNI